VEGCFTYIHGWIVSLFIDIHRSVDLDGTHVFYETGVITTLFLSGKDHFPTDEHGKSILDTIDFCAPWELSEYLKKGQQRKPE
jgi:hypothetical protein